MYYQPLLLLTLVKEITNCLLYSAYKRKAVVKTNKKENYKRLILRTQSYMKCESHFFRKFSFESNKEKEKMLNCGREAVKFYNCFH